MGIYGENYQPLVIIFEMPEDPEDTAVAVRGLCSLIQDGLQIFWLV